MDELVRWLGEQLDVDKAIAEAATWCEEAGVWHAEPSPFGAQDSGQRWYVEDAMDDGVVSHVDPKASDDEGVARHIAEWDPSRVLREITIDRELLAEYERLLRASAAHRKEADRMAEAGDDDPTRVAALRREADYLPAMLHVMERWAKGKAGVYSDRPGYTEAIASAE